MGYEPSGAHAKREPYAKLAIRNMLRGKSVELLLGDESGKASLAMIELTGSVASYKTLKSQSIKAEIEFVGQGLKGTTTTLSVYPGRSSTTMELTGLGKIHSGGWDGIVWESLAMQGQRLVKGAERSMMLRLNDIRAAADWRKYYYGATTEAEETIEGQPCYRVISKP